MMEGAPRSPLGRDGLSPPQRAEVNPLGATVITGAGSIDDGETCDEPTTANVTRRSTRITGWKRRVESGRWGWRVGVRLGYVQQQVHPRLSTRPPVRARLPTRP